ncbi:MAG TPA: PIG-L family deacetylase [Thermoanaerobaculia bacterium]|nr:PIG-L family deacetylase [Thermoanaerobaculia bacterium]
MNRDYAAIFLSPHLDDVTFSCGGQIAALTAVGEAVLVVTLAAGDPPPGPLSDLARSVHRRWGAGDVMAHRRDEDAEACRILGCDSLHLDLPDGIYRRDSGTGRPLYETTRSLYGAVHPVDAAIVGPLSERLDRLLQRGRLLAPLAVGGHVDHRLARAVAERWRGQAVVYYEDYPYAEMPGALEDVLGDREEWSSEVVTLGDEALRTKVRASGAYSSQVAAGDFVIFSLRQAAYAKRIDGERRWRRRRRM